MSPTTFLLVWTLVLAGAIVLALAGYLTATAWFLYRAGGHRKSHLARLADGLAQVRANAAPLEDRLTTIVEKLRALCRELEAADGELSETYQSIRD